ncbi:MULTISPECIES: DUF1367 family protein [unclassified Duganella]|uniref:DUF1367 family protein n=1 Tax=unclassified Duganella TaxID=2636909 RepID=UPI00087E3B42|nr:MULTISPECIES: DUF1367 family protein [unclassified Duganella]SDF79615.1 Protein of unknown function [Duganella sp. OV458]SDI49511.1 Protein of unknown function [Duganella sp. OV510]
MTDIVLMKVSNILVPHDEAAAAFIQKMKAGELTHADFKRVRNYKFHKKYFALLDFAFEQWEPRDGLTYQGMPVAKNKERFRKDLIILAGFYESTVNLRSEVRLEAKSISFGLMDEIEFEQLYNATVDVVLRRILTRYTRQDLDEVINQLLRFT